MPALLLPLIILSVLAILRILEFFDGSRLSCRDWRGELFRVQVHLTLFGLVCFATWRPILSLVIVTSGVTILMIANVIKKRVVFETIVFSDLGLLGQILRHPHLYFLNHWILAAAGAALLTAVVYLAHFEEPQPLAASLFAILLLGWIAVWAFRHQVVAHFESRVLNPHEWWGSRALGLPAALVIQWLGWLSAPSAEAKECHTVLPADTDIIAIQLESFAEMSERLGFEMSPLWRSLKARALAHGPLTVTIKGANTMRTEHAVLTGVPNEALGYDRFDPYLRPALGHALPALLARQGWQTTFIHPNDLRFFRRHRALPALGFTRLVGDRDFRNADRIGRYVSDTSLVQTIASQLQHSSAPAFVFAVTMENHGPWKEGRLPGVPGGMDSYRVHVANMEAAVADLLHILETRERRTILLLYGDHLPSLPETRDWTVYDTDYLILDTKSAARNAQPSPLAPDGLLQAAFALLRA